MTHPLARTSRRLVPLLALALALVLAACADDPETALEEAEEEGVAEGLVGETLTVSGEVSEVFPGGSFAIAGSDFAFGEPLEQGTLVVGEDLPEVSEEGFVQVTGTVVDFVVADVENEYGLTFEDAGLFVEYEEEYALVADAVEFIPEEAEDEDDTAVQEAEEDLTDELIVGDEVTISSEVSEVLSETAFTVGTDRTLILGAENTDVHEGGIAQITGTVVEFVIVDVEEEYGFDLDDELFVEFENELAVVADSVEFVPEDV